MATVTRISPWRGDGMFNHESVSIFLGDGAGNFSAPTNFQTGTSSTIAVAVGDFNGDGKQDLAFADDDKVSILLGDGTGNFNYPRQFSVGFYV